MLKSGYGLRDLIELLFADSGLQPRISFEADDVDTARGLVSAGLGVTVVPSYIPDAETVQLRIDHPEARPDHRCRRPPWACSSRRSAPSWTSCAAPDRSSRPAPSARTRVLLRLRSALTADERVRPIRPGDPAAPSKGSSTHSRIGR